MESKSDGEKGTTATGVLLLLRWLPGVLGLFEELGDVDVDVDVTTAYWCIVLGELELLELRGAHLCMFRCCSLELSIR